MFNGALNEGMGALAGVHSATMASELGSPDALCVWCVNRTTGLEVRRRSVALVTCKTQMNVRKSRALLHLARISALLRDDLPDWRGQDLVDGRPPLRCPHTGEGTSPCPNPMKAAHNGNRPTVAARARMVSGYSFGGVPDDQQC